KPRKQHDTLADPVAGDLFTHFAHDAGDIATGNARHHRMEIRHALHDEDIHVIEAASLDLNQGFVVRDGWLGPVVDLELLNPAVLLQRNYSHRRAGHLSFATPSIRNRPKGIKRQTQS